MLPSPLIGNPYSWRHRIESVRFPDGYNTDPVAMCLLYSFRAQAWRERQNPNQRKVCPLGPQFNIGFGIRYLLLIVANQIVAATSDGTAECLMA